MDVINKKSLFKYIVMGLLSGSLSTLVACSGLGSNHANQSAIIEDTPGGLELLEQEFGKCDPTEEIFVPDTPQYTWSRQGAVNQAASNQIALEASSPHDYSSEGKLFPNQGSWRKTKAEIMDIVDRYIYSPEENTTVDLLYYFDMVLLINVADRQASTPTNHSAQRMQIIVRNGSTSNKLEDWHRSATLPISSGKPCGSKRIITPTGVFKFNPIRIHEEYKSALWDDRDMFQTFFPYHNKQTINPATGKHFITGVALHGTDANLMLGRRDSGGCVRTELSNAQCLWDSFNGVNNSACIEGGLNDYRGKVPSFEPLGGEADPQYLSNNRLEVNGIRVLLAIYEDSNDVL